jgi:Flp pilus assembly protein TadD
LAHEVISRVSQRHVDLLSACAGFVLAMFGIAYGSAAYGVALGVAVAGLLDALGRYLVSSADERERARDRQRARFLRGELPVALADAVCAGGVYDLGVDREATQVLDELGERGRGSPYVGRDIDAPLRGWLREVLRTRGCGVVVLQGVAKAGKSRTLLAALEAQQPGAMLVRPADATALNELASECPPVLADCPAVIWLDDLEDWLAADAEPLTLKTVERLATWPSPVVLAGTLGGRGFVRLRDQQGDGPQVTEPIKQFTNGLRNAPGHNLFIRTLEAAQSDAESRRLDTQYGSGSTAEIAKAGGIGSYMIAGPYLLDRLREATDAHAAVVAAAIHWRHLGLVRPIPRATLDELHRLCIPPPAEADTTDALSWATERVYGSRLLIPIGHADDGEAYEPLDYIIGRVPVPQPRREFINHIINIAAETTELATIGFALHQTSDVEGAEAAWRRGDERGDAVAAFNLGILLRQRGDVEGAEAAYRRGDERGDADAAFNLGVLLHARGDVEGAEALWRRVDEQGHAAAAFNLGVLLEERGDVDGAEAAYRRGDERGQSSAASNLGALLKERGDLEGAEAACRRGDELGNPGATFNLGLLLHERGDVEDAEAAWRRSDEQGHAGAASNLGLLLKKCGDVDGAEAAYRRGDERGQADAAFNLGLLLKERGDLEGAEAAWRRGDERGHAVAAFNLGLLLKERGDVEGAEAAWRRGDERGHAVAAFNLGVLLHARGDVEDAEAAWRRADERGQADAAFNLGLLLMGRGDVQGAEAAWRRADERGHAGSALHLGMLQRSGDAGAAEAVHRRSEEHGTP